MTITGTITSIWTFPVKSMIGNPVGSAALTEHGIEGDRRFALRDVRTGKVVSAKIPSIGRKLLALEPAVDARGIVTLVVDGTAYRSSDAEALNAALSDHLGQSVELVGESREGDVYASHWPEIEGLALSDVDIDLPLAMGTVPGTFVDLAGLHILADSTIDALAGSLPDTQIDRRRFRPSFTVDVDTDEPFVENGWIERTATIGDAVIKFGVPSPRCVMATLGQPGLPAAKEILRTLAETNRHEMPGFGDFACLGIYAEVVTPGTISVGSTITID